MECIEILKNFQREIERKKESGSYLFYGDERVDLLEYAIEFSKMLLTREEKNEEIKNKIKYQIDSYQYPDVEVLNRNGENIKIDDVRNIIQNSVESSYGLGGKVFILCGAEQFRKEASNGLLKIIEEPPKRVFFILLSRTLNIIPTIKSRVVKFHLRDKSYEEMGISKEEYYFFDGNEKFIKIWKNINGNLEEYKDMIPDLDTALDYILKGKEIYKDENISQDKMINIIGYIKGIEFISKEMRFFSRIEFFKMINVIEEGYKQDRENLVYFLSKIILKTRNSLEGKTLKKLINFKNSIKNNVNMKSILFNFFEYLYE